MLSVNYFKHFSVINIYFCIYNVKLKNIFVCLQKQAIFVLKYNFIVEVDIFSVKFSN